MNSSDLPGGKSDYEECSQQFRAPGAAGRKRGFIMMNLHNKKTRRTITAVIIVVLVAAMVLPMILSYLSYLIG